MSTSIFRKRHYSWLSSHLRDEIFRIKSSPNHTPELIIFEKFVTNLCETLKAEHENFDIDQFLYDSDITPPSNLSKEIFDWWHKQGSRKTLSNL